MPVHPAAPADVTELAAAYRQTLTSFADLADGLREEDWARPTSCPGWSARDVLAHVVHIEDYLTGSEHPIRGAASAAAAPAAPDASVPPHVRNSFGAWNEEGVRARDHLTPAELVAELRGLLEVRSASMYDVELTLDTPVRSVRDRRASFGEVTRRRLVDVWVHEQDLREVVDRPGSLDSPGASQFVDLVMASLGPVVLSRLDLPPGTVVILESTGPVGARGGIRTGVDADGAPISHELFTGHPGEDTVDEDGAATGGDEQVTTIALSTHALTRRAAGRTPTEQTAYHVVGDEDLARRVLDALALTP